MAEYLNKELFLQSMGLLGDETKYGNRDGEHQSRSYGTWMGYEIMGSVEDSIVEEDVVPVVRCKDCKYQIKEWNPDNRMISKGYYTYGCDRNFHRYSSNAVNGRDNEFCSYGERKDNERKAD